MGRIVLAGVVVGLCASLATPALAQITNEACVLRCLDHGHLDQYCQRICTNGVPPAETPKPNRTALPGNAPAAAPPPQSPAPVPSPAPTAVAPSAQPPAAQRPAAGQSTPQPNVRPATQPAQNRAPPHPSVQPPVQPAQNQAPPQPTAQATPQQSVKPPAPPVNEMCVLRCLDHGHLDQYCQRICTVTHSPAPLEQRP